MRRSLIFAWLFAIAIGAIGLYLVVSRTETQTSRAETRDEMPETTFAGEGMAWRMRAWMDDNGNIPENPLQAAIESRETYLNAQSGTDGLSDDGTARLKFVPRGPDNAGGRTRSLIIHPIDPNIMWAGAVSGGIWKSMDGGISWYAGNHSINNFPIGSMAIDPTNPNILYAGTGEGFFLFHSIRGGGLFKTFDGGLTWNGPMNQTDSLRHINRVSAVNHGQFQYVLIAAEGPPLSGTGGIMRSTDGGDTWTREIPDTRMAHYVAFTSSDGSRAIADVVPDGCNCHRVMYWNDAEGWNTSTFLYTNEEKVELEGNFTNMERIELAYSRDDPDIVYAAYNRGGTKLARSDNGGQRFTEIQPDMETPIGVSWHNNTLWVSPNDPDFVIVGGPNLHRSTDGGRSFVEISNGYIMEAEAHPDQHCIVPDPYFDHDTNKRVYVCNDGGVYRTEDITTADNDLPSWESLNATYQTSQFYGADGDSATGFVVGGTQDNATPRLLGLTSEAWYVDGGDGGQSAVDPSNNDFCYGEYVGRLFRSSACTSANPNLWNFRIHQGITDMDIENSVAFIGAVELNPHNFDQMYYGVSSLWRTDHVRGPGYPEWDEIRINPTVYLPNPTPGTTPVPAYKPMRVDHVAIAPSNPDVVWISEYVGWDPYGTIQGPHNGRLIKTTTATSDTPEWIDVDNNTTVETNLPNRPINRIVIAPESSDKVYVAFAGFEPDNLWRTTDGGANWTDITGPDPDLGLPGLPKVPIRAFARHPIDPNRFYAGTEIGMYVSENAGVAWKPVMEGPVNVSIDELTFMHINPQASPQPTPSTKLLVATYGRGLWITDVDSPANGNRALNDFDGDGRSDISVMRLGTLPSPSASPTGTPPQSTWHVRRSNQGYFNHGWGVEGDQIAAEDFNGDGKTDIAVFRPTGGYWYWWNGTSQVSEQWGQPGDIAVPADYDGDGTADLAVFRPSTGVWYIKQSSDTSTYFLQFG